MSKRMKRMGGKFTGSHTTVIPAAGLIADIASECRGVTKIALGFIKSGLPSSKGMKMLKVTEHANGTLLLAVRDRTAHQELRVFVTDTTEVLHTLRERAREAGFRVSIVKVAQ